MGALSFLFPDEPLTAFPARYPPAEALAKLQAKIDFKFALMPADGVHGRMVGDEIRIWRVRMVRNSFRPIFAGRLIAHASGSTFEGRFGPGAPSRIFAIVWMSFALLITALLTFVFLTDPRTQPYAFAPPLMGVFFAGIAWLITKLGAWLGAQDREMITAAIKDALA